MSDMIPALSLYVTDHEIPAFGAHPGDLVLIRPAHAVDPLMIIRRFDREQLPFILDHFDQLRLVSQPRLRRQRQGETFSREVVANL